MSARVSNCQAIRFLCQTRHGPNLTVQENARIQTITNAVNRMRSIQAGGIYGLTLYAWEKTLSWLPIVNSSTQVALPLINQILKEAVSANNGLLDKFNVRRDENSCHLAPRRIYWNLIFNPYPQGDPATYLKAPLFTCNHTKPEMIKIGNAETQALYDFLFKDIIHNPTA